jgi:hypothetical protein
MRPCTEEEFQRNKELTETLAPHVLPVWWEKVDIPPSNPFYGQQWYRNMNGLSVVFTADQSSGDGKTWLHVSMSRRSRMPTYEDMKEVKELFVGRNRQALQIFPKESEHVNIHNYCLHLWCAIEGDGLPAFGEMGTI